MCCSASLGTPGAVISARVEVGAATGSELCVQKQLCLSHVFNHCGESTADTKDDGEDSYVCTA